MTEVPRDWVFDVARFGAGLACVVNFGSLCGFICAPLGSSAFPYASYCAGASTGSNIAAWALLVNMDTMRKRPELYVPVTPAIVEMNRHEPTHAGTPTAP